MNHKITRTSGESLSESLDERRPLMAVGTSIPAAFADRGGVYIRIRFPPFDNNEAALRGNLPLCLSAMGPSKRIFLSNSKSAPIRLAV